MEISKAVEIAVQAIGKEEFKTDEIAEHISLIADFKDVDKKKIEERTRSYINNHSKGKDPLFSKVLNKKKQHTRSMYRLVKKKENDIILRDKVKNKKSVLPKKPTEQNGVLPDFNNPQTLFGTDKLYLGKAGEFAVISELLFCGYNASIMSVDEGIDITASKNDKFFFIQVKSTNFNNDTISVSIKPNRFINNSNSDIYYVIMFRYIYKGVNTNRYIIIQNKLMEHYVLSGEIVQNTNGTVNIKIKQKNGHLYLYNGKDKEAQIDHWLDNFNSIK